MDAALGKLQEIINIIEDEALSNASLNLTGKEKQYAACLCLRLALEYYERAVRMTEDGDIYMASLVSRTAIENVADMAWVLENKTDEFAKRYIDSIGTFTKAFQDFQTTWPTTPEEISKLSKRRLRVMNRVNDWTGHSKVSIDTRIKHLGGDLIFEYDMLSYFIHPNPAIAMFMTSDNNIRGQAQILALLNVNLLLVAIADFKIYGPEISVTEDEIDEVGKSFHLKLFSRS